MNDKHCFDRLSGTKDGCYILSLILHIMNSKQLSGFEFEGSLLISSGNGRIVDLRDANENIKLAIGAAYYLERNPSIVVPRINSGVIWNEEVKIQDFRHLLKKGNLCL